MLSIAFFSKYFSNTQPIHINSGITLREIEKYEERLQNHSRTKYKRTVMIYNIFSLSNFSF